MSAHALAVVLALLLLLGFGAGDPARATASLPVAEQQAECAAAEASATVQASLHDDTSSPLHGDGAGDQPELFLAPADTPAFALGMAAPRSCVAEAWPGPCLDGLRRPPRGRASIS